MNAPLSPSRKNTIELLTRPWEILRGYSRQYFSADLAAGLTVAIVLLPQAIAFSLIAELPPQMGLYSAILGGIVGALWGSSNQNHTGPANAISLLVLSALSLAVEPGSGEYILAAGLLAVMVGVFQLAMGLARMGILVNFVSHSVIIGFTSGAGVLIILKQLSPLTRFQAEGENIWKTTWEILLNLVSRMELVNLYSLALGLGAAVIILIANKLNPRIPASFIAMLLASLAVYFLGLDKAGVAIIGQLPSELPPLVDVSKFSIELVSKLSAGALAVGAIGLVETAAISRSIAAHTRQRLDNNQEFVGQGLANIFSGLFSGYATAGSFSRSALNFNANAKTPMAAVFSSLFVLAAMFLLAPLAVFLPRAALAGVLIATAIRIIDREEIERIWKGSREDALIMVVTFLGTLVLNIEFAVLAGILLSLAIYILKTSVPVVVQILPEESFAHLAPQPRMLPCPQLAILAIQGDIYFGAVNHVDESIRNILAENPSQRYLLIHMRQVVNMDISGIHMLESLMETLRERGGDLFLTKVQPNVMTLMADTHFYEELGLHNILTLDFALDHLFYKVLDPAVCIYECDLRVFAECQNLPKRNYVYELPLIQKLDSSRQKMISPRDVWEALQCKDPPLVIDVREPREFLHGHIPGAKRFPLPLILSRELLPPRERHLVLVCRTGRRSARAASLLDTLDYDSISIVEGGMIAWENSGLLTAVDRVEEKKNA